MAGIEISNFSKFLFEKEKGKKKKSKTSDAEETKSSGSKITWMPEWNIPIDPNAIQKLMINSEACVRYSMMSIERINSLFTEKERENAEPAINKIQKAVEDIKEQREKIYLKGEDKKSGLAFNFWEKYKEAKDIKDKATLVMDTEEGRKGITQKEMDSFVGGEKEKYGKFGEAEALIETARKLVDTGEMSKYEYIDNIENYSKDEDKKGIGLGEGLKKVMYTEIKTAISDFQSSIDNYLKALHEYLDTFKEFINDAKESTIAELGNELTSQEKK